MSQKIQSLKGMNDIYFDEVRLWQELESKAKQIFENYGYSEIRTPLLEESALFSRGIGQDNQVVQKEMYTFLDKSGDSVSLRPEGTASVVRAYIQNSLYAQDESTKLYYSGPMFRYERPQKGRLRQFHQIGCEWLGSVSDYADAEQILMLNALFKELGLSDFTLHINSLGLIHERQNYLVKLTDYFLKYKDELDTDSQNRLQHNPLRIFDSKDPKTQKIALDAPLISHDLSPASRAHFDGVKNLLTKAGVPYFANERLVRGLDYYEHTTFEFHSPDLGAQSAFAGGGRYNRLVEELGGKPTPSVGFAMGCERVVLLLANGRTLIDSKIHGVFFVPLDDAGLDLCFEAMQFVRANHFKADMNFEVKSIKSQMRRADKLKFRYVALLGETERQKKVFMLKDMQTGTQSEQTLADIMALLNG